MNIKRSSPLLLLIVIASLYLVPSALAQENLDNWNYQASLTVVNNSGSALASTPVAVTFQPANLIASGYMLSDAQDARIVDTTSESQEFVGQDMADDDVTWWLTVDSLADGGSRGYAFHTGYGSATRDQGFVLDATTDTITTADHADLDITADLVAAVQVNFNTWPTTNTYLVLKDSQYVIGAGQSAESNALWGRITTGGSAGVGPLRTTSTGDSVGTPFPSEVNCLTSTHWACLGYDSDGKYLEGNDGTSTWTEAVNVADFAPDFAYITAVGINCGYSFEVGDTVTVALRLNGTTGSFYDAEAGGACGGTGNITRPGGGDWHAGDIDDVQVVVRVVEDGSGGTADKFEYASLSVTYQPYEEVVSTVDDAGSALATDTDYITRLEFNNHATTHEIHLYVNGGLVDTASANATAITTTDSSLTLDPNQQATFVDTEVGARQNIVWDSSFAQTSPALDDWVEYLLDGAAGSTSRVITQERCGVSSLEIVLTDSNGTGADDSVERRQTAPAGTVSGGEHWSFSAWVHTTAMASTAAVLLVEWIDAGGAYTGMAGQPEITTTNSDFERLSITDATAPATTDRWRVRPMLRTDTANASGTAYWDCFQAVKSVTLPGWTAATGDANSEADAPVLEWEFEPDDLVETQQGDSSNSWIYTGTVEDVSSGGSDHDGTYSLTRDMTGINAYLSGLLIKDLGSLTIDAELIDILDLANIDPTGGGGTSTFPFITEANTNLTAFGDEFTMQFAWFVFASIIAAAFSLMVLRTNIHNGLLVVLPFPVMYWLAWGLVDLNFWLVFLMSLASLGCAFALKAFGRELA